MTEINMAAVRRRFLLSPDCANRDPFRGRPLDLAPGQSRVPLVPAKGYGDLSFDPSTVHNGDPEGTKVVDPSEYRRRWREAVQQALGNLVEIRLDDDSRD
jgi:hypothetical protein